MTSFYEQIRQELVDYTEEDKAKTDIQENNLLELALREIQNENNYLNMMKRAISSQLRDLRFWSGLQD